MVNLQILQNGTAVSYSKATDPLCLCSKNRIKNTMEFDVKIKIIASKNDVGSIRTEFNGPLQSDLSHRE